MPGVDDVRNLIELRNKLADIADVTAETWPELQKALQFAELLVQRRIVATGVPDQQRAQRKALD